MYKKSTNVFSTCQIILIIPQSRATSGIYFLTNEKKIYQMFPLFSAKKKTHTTGKKTTVVLEKGNIWQKAYHLSLELKKVDRCILALPSFTSITLP